MRRVGFVRVNEESTIGPRHSTDVIGDHEPEICTAVSVPTRDVWVSRAGELGVSLAPEREPPLEAKPSGNRMGPEPTSGVMPAIVVVLESPRDALSLIPQDRQRVHTQRMPVVRYRQVLLRVEQMVYH
jgi:hypothetical protein